ncbi:hypothetical protein EON65_40910 [archaeon]|nr:MAG: hypothetical protein EON65_40910 [archaeon]
MMLGIWTHLFFLLLCPGILSLGGLFDRTNLPRFKDTDSIEVYHLRSIPALLIETVAGTFSTQSSGLALRSTSTNEVVVLQYKPKSYSGCFLPIIQIADSQDYNLFWDNRAELVYHNEIDSAYWQQSTFLAHINGIVYKNYVMWIEKYMQANRAFIPQSICNSEHELACYVRAVTWDAFLQDSLKVFAAYTVSIHAVIPPRATELRFLTGTEPIIVQAVMDIDELGEHGRRYEGGGSEGVPHRIPRALYVKDVFDDIDTEENKENKEVDVNAANPNVPKVAVHELVNYYQELMSCMQGT